MEKNWKEYKEYVRKCWKESEEIATEIGCTDNEVVRSVFNKVCQPYFYWNKNLNGNK